jgi:hypothetical protein
MRTGAIALVMILAAAGCAPKLRPTPTTDQGRACVSYCEESVSPCKAGCLWWLAGGALWPILFVCQGGCDTDYNRCEQACPDMRYPQVSTSN